MKKPNKKFLLTLILPAFVILCGILVIHLRTRDSLSPAKIRKINPILADASYQGKEKAGEELSGEENILVFTDDRCRYCANEAGYIVMIEDKDSRHAVYPEQPSPDYTAKAAAADAEKLFDEVFYWQEALLGTEKTVSVDEFDGAGYPVTIQLMDGGKESGNSASIRMAGDGRLIAAVFTPAMYEGTTPKGEEIPEEAARFIACEYYRRHYRDKDISWILEDQLLSVEITKCRRNTIRGKVYWDVSIMGYFESPHEEVEKDYYGYTIRINACTGRIVSVARTA